MPVMRSWSTLLSERRRLLGFLGLAGRAPLAVTVSTMATTVIVPLATVVVAGVLVGRIAEQVRSGDHATGAILPLLLLLTALVMASEVLNAIYFVVGAWLAERIDGRIRSEVRQLLATPEGVSHLEVQGIRDAAGLAASGLNGMTIGFAATGQLWRLWRMAGALGSAVIVARFAPGIALVLLVTLVAQRIVLARQAKQLVEVGVTAYPAFRGSQYWADVAGGAEAAKEVRVFGLERWAVERQRECARAARQPVWAFLDVVMARQWNLLGLGLIGAFVGFGGLAVLALQGHLAVRDLVVAYGGVLGMAQIAFPGVEAFAIEAGRPAMLALTMLRSLRPGPPDRPSRPAVPLGRPRSSGPPSVRFEEVHFTYPSSSRPVLNGVDLDVAPGERVAIVGANGAGKTTLMKLLAGFHIPSRGRVVVDGVDLREIDLPDWWGRLAVVFQDFSRLELPAVVNVALAGVDQPVEGEALRAAAGAAGLQEVIDQLPARWETTLSSGFRGGVGLSGGQWQRVALARGLYAVRTGARMVVLDEPTAQIDVAAEADIFDRVLDHAGGATTIVISHRFSTVRRADRIVVLADGVITEDGSHDELIRLGGRYAAMYEMQAASFQPDAVPPPVGDEAGAA